MPFIHPARFSEATRFMMLDAVTAFGGIIFGALAIRQAWRRYVWLRALDEATPLRVGRSGRAKWPEPRSSQQGMARRIFPAAAAIAAVIVAGAVAYSGLGQDRVVEGPVRVID